MRQLAVCNNNILNLTRRDGVKLLDSAKMKIGNENFLFGLLQSNINIQTQCNDDEVIVKKMAFSCNFRDKGISSMGKHYVDKFALGGKKRYYPIGSEFSGVVVKKGIEVKTLSIGDRVIGNGSFPFSGVDGVRAGVPTNHGSKEFEAFHPAKVIKIGESMSFAEAAAFPIGAQTAYSMIRRLNLKEGDNVLVTSASSNTSIFALNKLINLGVNVCAITTRKKFKTKLLELGLNNVFVVDRNHKKINEYAGINKYISDNGLFDGVIDPFFDVYLKKVIESMNVNSSYITCGFSNQVTTSDQVNDGSLSYILGNAMIKNISLIGNCIGTTQDLQNALLDYEKGLFKVILHKIYKGNTIKQFLEDTFTGSDRFGKVVYQYCGE